MKQLSRNLAVGQAYHNNLGMDLEEPVIHMSPILYGLMHSGVDVEVFFLSGIKLVGKIDWFDEETLTLRLNGRDQSVYRRALACVQAAPGTIFR